MAKSKSDCLPLFAAMEAPAPAAPPVPATPPIPEPSAVPATPPVPPASAAPPVPARRWTASQQAAIEHTGGDLLVSAAAGSGKTAVLAERCARLVTMDGPQRSSIERLLVVTFTEAAATEMRARIARELRKRIDAAGEDPQLLRQAALIDRAAISTLHGFCTRTLRAYFHEAAAPGEPPLDPSFEIIDADEARLLQDEVLDAIFRRRHLADAELARTHTGERSGFAALLESHAQGSDSALKKFILDLHRMLVTLRNPDQWLRQARRQYTPQGADEVLAEYARHIAAKLRLEAARGGDCAARLRRVRGCESMAGPLEGFRDTMANAAAALEKDGIQGWDTAQAMVLAFEWPAQIRNTGGVEEFAALKKQTIDKAKDALKKLQTGEFGETQTAASLRANLLAPAAAANVLIELAGEFNRAFTAAKRAQSRLDFADLERLTLDLLTRAGSQAAADLRRRFDHVLVDEFQDINPLQAALLEAVCSPDAFGGRGNFFVVGDVKQSIYGFRLADPQEFLNLEQRLRGTASHRAFLPLQHNFRTAPHLLGNMNAIFSTLFTRDVAGVDYTQDHRLNPPPGSAIEEGAAPIELIVVVPPADPDAADEPDDADPQPNANGSIDNPGPIQQLTDIEREARYVAQKIAAMVAARTPVKLSDGTTRPLQYRDIAILLRSVKDRALLFARALAQRNIPVHADLSTGYFDAQEVRDALSLLSVLDNPFQDIPLATLLLSPIGRFSHDDLSLIRLAHPRRHQVPFHQAVHKFMIDDHPSDAARDLAARLRALFDRLDTHRRRARVLPLHDALAEMYDETGLLTYVAGLPGGTQRIANLQSLHHRARQFSGFRRQGLYRFLRFIDQLRDNEVDFGEAHVLSEASDVVRIMSIHKSKGLEFPVVFVSTLGAKFNLDVAKPLLIDRDHHLAMAGVDEKRNIFIPTPLTALALARGQRQARAEELRLLYVAMTRARERLILTGAAKAGAWEAADDAWSRHQGPLPKYHLLRGNTFLDYLLPAAALPGMADEVAVEVTEVDAPRAIDAAGGADAAALLEGIVADRRDKLPPASNPQVNELIRRLDYRYPFMPLARTPALFTVSELKKRAQRHAELSAEDAIPQPPPAPPAQKGGPPDHAMRSAAIARGIATHRVLELIDFAAVHSPPALDAFVADLVARDILTPPQAAALHRPSILWFLQTEPALRLRRIAANPNGPARLLREVPFVFSLDVAEVLDSPLPAEISLSPGDRRDMPQLRGVIDLLVVDGTTAEILDYKTDSQYTIAAALPMYRRQMQYYMRAVTACLGLQITKATLVCLSTRQLEIVPN